MQVTSCGDVTSSSCEIYANGAGTVVNITQLTDNTVSVLVQVCAMALPTYRHTSASSYLSCDALNCTQVLLFSCPAACILSLHVLSVSHMFCKTEYDKLQQLPMLPPIAVAILTLALAMSTPSPQQLVTLQCISPNDCVALDVCATCFM